MSENLENMEEMEQNTTPDGQVDPVEETLNEEAPQIDVAELDNLEESKPKKSFTDAKLDFLQDLELDVYIELGRSKMKIKDILELERGYVIELDKLASEPVDIYVNNKKIADGEVVVIDKHFGIRIINLNDPAKRIGEMY